MTVGKATAIIPARLGSTRFPRKALASESGRPMVVHVCERAGLASRVGRVVVATDSEEIASAVRAHGYEAVLTGEHENGTSRVAEAARLLGLGRRSEIVNVQGDEPEIDPGLIDAALVGLGVQLNGTLGAVGGGAMGREVFAGVSTVASPFGEGEDPSNPNIVKAVVGYVEPRSGVGPGLYFTRAAAPFSRDGGGGVRPLKHIGLYAYSNGALQGYVSLPETGLERTERLEQLRWLAFCQPIAVAIRESAHHGVDTAEEYAGFVSRWRAQNG